MAGGGSFDRLRLEDVTRRFGEARALEGLNLEIKGGEFIALLGPSGCGKSTALNCLAGLLPLTEGSIWLDDGRIDHLPPEQRDFGMVFQSYALFPHLSVRRNVGFGLSMRGVHKDETKRRVEDALNLVQLAEHAEKYPAQLSGGQQQRVAIARAVVLEPRVVLMDEPLSNLDAKLRLEMRTEIRRLHQKLALTTVYVTHDQEEALSLADRIVVLREGRVQQIGTPEDVYTEPVNRYVASFMGYRNLFELEIESAVDGHVRLVGDGLRFEGRNRQSVTSGRAVAAVRPEDFSLQATNENRTDARVEVVEFKGRELDIEAVTGGGGKLHFRTGERLSPGDRITLGVPRERVLVFAAGDEPTLQGKS